jgi:RHS repeat-associated protein
MFSRKVLGQWLRLTVTALCILGLLVSSVPRPIKGVIAQVDSEPARARSNHNTQVKVFGPYGVRVNTWNGNLFYPVPLLAIPGRGLPVEISLSYNSSWHDFATHFGYGWQLSYNMFYVRDENGGIIVVWEDGRAERFVKSSGSFLSPVDTYDTLREFQPGKYILQTKHGIEFYFDSPVHKRLTKVREPNGHSLTFAYDSDMLLTSITDTSGRRIQLSYTGGNLKVITDTSLTRSIQFGYDASNNLINITDALGNTTLYGYDSNHFLTGIALPIGTSTIITYSNGAVTQVSGELTMKSFSYDTANRITTMTDAAPEGGQITRFFYDAEGRISTIEDPLSHRVSLTWDANNNIISFTDALNRTTTYTYDARGNLLTVTDALSHTTMYAYESTYNRLMSVTDANGRSAPCAYDSWGNLIRESDPLNNTTTYTYDSQGDLISRTDANDRTTTYRYDDHGNLINVTDLLSNTVSYSYDAVGNLTGMTNTHASVLYTYDALNQVTNVDYASHGKSISYAYNAVGNRTRMTDPDGGVTTYGYDAANRPATLTNPLGQTTRYTYDSKGRLTRKDYHNGTYALYTYDRANRVLSLINKKYTGEVISSYTYEYDAAGNRTKMTEADGGVTTYTYDALNQLTKVVYPDGAFQEYTYDNVGNRLVLRDSTGTTNYSYDAADRLQSAGTVTYGWDNNGNQIRKTDGSVTTTYGYDYENRLISIAFPDGNTNTFTYYPDGRRLSKTDTSGQTTHYFYDGPNAIVEANSAGATIAHYTSGLGIDDWISMDRGGSSYYYYQDGLGSVTGLTDTSGAVVATYRYDVFGLIRGQAGNVVNPYGFTGRDYDAEARLYYYRARYYDTGIGRFITSDPINLVGGLNPYSYALNNPVSQRDPMGLFPPPPPPFFPLVTVVVVPSRSHDVLLLENSKDRDSENASSVTDPYFWGSAPWWTNFLPIPWWTGPFWDLIFPSSLGGGDEVPSSGWTGDGSSGGVESKPLNVIPSAFLGETGPASTPDQLVQSAPLVSLRDIMPTVGPVGTTPVPVTPPAPLGGTTNAVDAAAVDFVDTTTPVTKTKATVFATKTISRTYEHDYSVCNRFHDYTLESAAAIPLPGVISGATDIPWFWYASTTKGQLVEESFIFAVFVDEDQKTFTMDSRWLTDYYPTPATPAYDYVFNFQIWASSSEEAYKLLRRTLANLANFGPGWTVNFTNATEPVAPAVLIKSAELVGSTVRMTVQSWLTQTQTVRFFGTMRYPSDRVTNVPFAYERTLEPGFNVVELPLGNILDAVVQVQVNNFLDRVYVGTGSWFAFDDTASGGSSSVALTLPNCTQATNLSTRDLILVDCAEITGSVGINGWVGMARTLNPNGRPIDISQYQALTFFAKGDGKSYRVSIETESVGQLNSADFHQFVFTTSPEGRQFVIPLASFSQQGWDPTKLVPFTGKDVKAIVWSSVGSPHDSIGLAVDRVAFVNSTLISGTTALSNTTNVAGPYTVTTQIRDDVSVQSASLLYSVNGGHTFTRVPMAANGNTFSATIPGQPLGTEVRYYVEATDADGNVATDPVDIPYTTYRFQVSELPYLLVDDFTDTNPVNVLGGNSWPFGTESGGSILMYYDLESIRLVYDVLATSSYAGYSTLLRQANVTPYNAVAFLIKGARGGEKVKIGLRDSSGNEPKIVLSQYLPRGITTSWQKVTIPLAAFTRVTNWSSMESFVIAFENRIGSESGTIYLDDIKFEQIPFAPIIVDNFNDMTGENGLGGSLWTSSGGGATITTAYDPANRYGDNGAGYRVFYSGVTGTAWTAAGTDLMGLNASIARTLSFYIKGAHGGERPNIYLASRIGGTETGRFVDIENYITVTTSWQRVDIPLKDFAIQGIDLTNLAYFQVVFEWEEMAGTIYLDDIQFNAFRIFLPIIWKSYGW